MWLLSYFWHVFRFFGCKIFEDGINEPTDDPKFVSKWARNRAYLVYPINAVLQYHRLGNQERVNPEIPFEKVTLVLREISLTLTEVFYFLIIWYFYWINGDFRAKGVKEITLEACILYFKASSLFVRELAWIKYLLDIIIYIFNFCANVGWRVG